MKKTDCEQLLRNDSSIPIVVDLDGTLLDSDLLIESAFLFFRKNPLKGFMPLAWLATGGKAQLKSKIAHHVMPDVSVLPYNPEVLAFISAEKANGRKIVLATASHVKYAKQISDHLGLFDRVLATDDINFSGFHKADRLVRDYGERGFDYIGNESADLLVWASARKAYVVNATNGVLRRACMQGNVERVFATRPPPFHAWIKAVRLHQWLKNLLVFVPLLAAHKFDDGDLFLRGMLSFFVFGLCASSVYVLNDLLDLEDDRHHATKRNRPFAAGSLSLLSGIAMAPTLLFIAFGLSCLFLPISFTLTILLYYLLTLAYTLLLKRVVIVDVITLGFLYTIRIIGGTFAFQLEMTFWLLAFSTFIFLSLALVKRYAELVDARLKGKSAKTRGRGYYPSDLEMLSSLGGSAGYLSVMVLALYIQDGETLKLYRQPQLIWLTCPLLLFWVSRTWMLTHRGKMHDDPVVFAIKDKISLVVGVLFGAIFWIAR